MYNSIFRKDLFDNTVTLITGGGTGIGRAIAYEIASLGGQVVIASRKQAVVDATAQAIRDVGGKADAYTVNIRDADSVEALVKGVIDAHGRIDSLVNNAGGQFPSRAEDISPNGWQAVIETNLTGPFLMSQAVFRHYMAQHGGAIVSIVAEMWRGFPMMAHTGAARAGMVNLTKTLAVEWAHSGVRINAVAPGIIDGNGIRQYAPEFRDSFLKIASKEVPVKRMGTESEVAATVTFLLSPAAAYITGDTIRVDGGSSLWRQAFAIDDHDTSQPYSGFDDDDA